MINSVTPMFIVFLISILSLVFAGYLAYNIMKRDKGSLKMQEIANAIKEGANAFVKRQYMTIAVISLVLAAIIFGAYYAFGEQELGIKTSISFIVGAFCSALSGIIGMWISVRANLRTAAAAK